MDGADSDRFVVVCRSARTSTAARRRSPSRPPLLWPLHPRARVPVLCPLPRDAATRAPSMPRGRPAKKGPPAHQNKFAFKHNPGSKLTKKILAAPIVGLCRRCSEIVEWRKKYRKYKPLTAPGKWYAASAGGKAMFA